MYNNRFGSVSLKCIQLSTEAQDQSPLMIEVLHVLDAVLQAFSNKVVKSTYI